MDYEKHFKWLLSGIMNMLEQHINAWQEASGDGFDMDEALKNVHSDEPAAPVHYEKRNKKDNGDGFTLN